MADNAWGPSGCQPNRPDVWYYGVPGQGCWYWTARFGQHWVGSPLGTYGRWNWECGALGPPVKDFEFLSEFGAAGQWFQSGAIYFKNGAWKVAIGDYGQTAGRLVDVGEFPSDAEMPPGHEAEPADRPASPEA